MSPAPERHDPGPMGVSRRRIIWRRIVAVAAVVVATAVIALVLSDDETEVAPPAAVSGGEVPAGVRELVADLTLEEKVDQVLALGFDGTDASAPFLDSLEDRQVGAIYVGAENWLDATQGAALIESAEGGGGWSAPGCRR